MDSPPLLQLTDLSKRFGGVRALSSVSMTLRHGRVYGLAGENGAGKSTLVKILCGVHAGHEGQMLLEGEVYRPRSTAEAERAGLSVFHQEIPICPSLSVAANVFLGPELPDRSVFPNWRKIEAQCEALFLDLLGMPISARRLMSDCSAAERQLALLVRVLSRRARCVILDEPTTALTPPEVAKLFAIIQRLRAKGLTFLFVSHLLDELLELCDEIFVLRDGALVGHRQRGQFDTRSLAQLIAGREVWDPASISNPVAGNPQMTPPRLAYERDPSPPLGERVGERRSSEAPKPLPPPVPKLEVCNLSRLREFRDVSFRLQAGEILGITGLQGSGRSAVARALFGAPPADAGTILLDGKEISIASVADALRNGIGYVPEDRQALGLFDDLDVRSNLGILRLDSMLRLGLLSSNRLGQLALTMQAKLQIKFASPEAPIRSLSGGNQQKVLIGRWLAANPEVLVMNEPTRGVDIGAKDEICRFIRALAGERSSFVVSSSDLDELIRLADRVLVMNGGQLAAEFSRGTFGKADLIHAAGAALRPVY
jgi:ABC-type sugar transport system ATPase subunit